MKKILSSLLIFGVLFSSISSALAEDVYNQYLPRVQSAIENMTPEERIVFEKRINSEIEKTDNTEVKEFLESIENLLYENFIDNLFDEILGTENENIIEDPKENIDIPNYIELSDLEKRTVSYEITKLQANLEDEAQSLLSQIISSWNSLTRYTEKGSVTANMDLSVEDFIDLQAGMNISQYTAQNQNLDSSLSADIDGFYNIATIFNEYIEISGKTNLELIQKGNETYLLLNNTQLSSSDEGIEVGLSGLVESLAELAQDNTYISFGNQNNFDTYDVLGYFTQENIQSEIDTFFSENLLEAYGKNENGYLLRPSKHFCDMGKSITNVFDPFNGKQCSERQYENMLQDFMDSGIEMSMEIGDEIILNISGSDTFEPMDMQLIWKNASLHEVKFSLVDNDDVREYVNVHYIAENLLNISVPKQPFDPELLLEMQLGRNNSIQRIDLQASFEDELTLTGLYENGQISSSVEINTPYLQASCSAEGNAYTRYLKLTAACDISGGSIDTSSQTLSIDSSLLYDGAAGNNFSWTVDALSDENNYLSFDIQSSAQRTSTGTSEIQAPKKTIDYFDFLSEVYPSTSFDDFEDFDTDYEYEFNDYGDYSEGCYNYDSGDRTCYEYHDDKTVTCEFSIESGEELCETFEYGYTIQETSFDDFDRLCYNYDSGDTTCYDYYDDKTVTCEFSIESNTETCETNEYGNYIFDEEYGEELEGVEDAIEE